jgi:hypothetical protein
MCRSFFLFLPFKWKSLSCAKRYKTGGAALATGDENWSVPERKKISSPSKLDYYYFFRGAVARQRRRWRLLWAGSGPGPSPTCRLGLGLLLHKPKAGARAGLVFGLSPQSRLRACKPGQARPAKARARARARPEPMLYMPDPAQGSFLQLLTLFSPFQRRDLLQLISSPFSPEPFYFAN